MAGQKRLRLSSYNDIISGKEKNRKSENHTQQMLSFFSG
jgi:hypothetical protein